MSSSIDGVINIKKESGYTSHDVVACVRKILGEKKVGHTGTLDPQATGVLPICIGRCTKLSQRIMDGYKVYIGTVLLGVKTDTQDIWGTIVEEKNVNVTEEEIINTVGSFLGKQEQLPPMYSAIKINGKKLYELARKGKEVERKKKEIEIKEIEVTKIINKKEIEIKVKCTKGTYIRTLFTDISEKLGTIGTMSSLTRIETGSFKICNAITLDELKDFKAKGELDEHILSVEDILPNHKKLIASSQADIYLENGNKLSLNFFKDKVKDNTEYIVYKSTKELIGLFKIDKNMLKPIIMLKNRGYNDSN